MFGSSLTVFCLKMGTKQNKHSHSAVESIVIVRLKHSHSAVEHSHSAVEA